MTSKGSKLLAILLIAVVVAAGAGYWMLTPKMTNELMSTVHQTSLLTPLERSQTSAKSTIPISATTTALATTAWINVNVTQPMNYYLSLLESNGTQPYLQLARELRKLPDLKNATAVAKITFLALNTTNPEVKEAFELIIKGGTPNPWDFSYTVPNYNTELEALYWLALQNGFKKDDTLALSIAMVNGFWVTIGNEQVRGAVKIDAASLLVFFRETNELQKQRGYFQLEQYPLEAKVCLAWIGGDPARGGRAFYQMVSGGPTYQTPLNIHHLLEYGDRRMDLNGYEWNTVSISTLRKMRETMANMGWVTRDADGTVRNVEEYFYFSGFNEHWIFTQPNDTMITFENQQTINHNMNNPDLVFDNYLRTGKAFGVCGDEASLIESFSKSWGISTIRLTRTYGTAGGNNHDHIIYYEPVTRTWRCYYGQLNIGFGGTWNIYIFRPPAIQRNFFTSHHDNQQSWMIMLNVYYAMESGSGTTLAMLFQRGVPTSQMKLWLLYS